jgi:hypothetical protein
VCTVEKVELKIKETTAKMKSIKKAMMMYHRLTVNQSLSPIKDEPQDADETTQLFVY